MSSEPVSCALRRNVELKARCADLAAARRVAATLGALRQEDLHQIDTYFAVAHGRLKLRETQGRGAELIWYERPDAAAARTSRYTIVPAPRPELLLAELSAACGVRARVSKRRELWLVENARIHLDEVEGLGGFLEFEAVLAADAAEATGHELLRQLRSAFAIPDEALVDRSYVDLIVYQAQT